MLTLKEVQETLPANYKGNMTQDMVNQLNALSNDPEEARHIRENFVNFASVLSEGRFKMSDYVRAVMYVSHKLMGKSNMSAYKETFPGRYAKMVAAGKPDNQISSIVSIYNKGLLVTEITQRAMVPTWILNQHHFQSAINVQATIMNDTAVSERVRVEAANSLLTHLKRPETKVAELNIDINMSDGMLALEDSLNQMAQMQRDAIEHDAGVSAKDITDMPMKVINP